MTTTRIILCGCHGHMGKVITSICEKRDDIKIVAGVDFQSAPASYPVYKYVTEVKEDTDVVIDFSHPSALPSLLQYSKSKCGVPLVLCTTGYSQSEVESLKEASKEIPVFYSRNMSLGINLLIELAKKAAAVLGDSFDVEIIEKHHNLKIDAPSGTALMIADAVAGVLPGDNTYMYDRHSQRKRRDKSEIGIHAVRGGTIVGEHEIIFAGNHETVSISHSAQSKDLFANGAVNAAIYMNGKKAGLYDMSALI
ncbi:MAG: 4-hydroxy-tetrahydrodipicolinate reductase [Ruminococcaceae bacterium]|nr:4-hydroxy-tetrahydrodipicolinate reductase [Oscillospiraceae bacterium]